VMDVRMRFRKLFREYNDRTCIVVVDIREVSVGLIVDSVSEVLSIPDSEIVPPPDAGKGANRYIQGIGKCGSAVTLLLDCDKLLNDEETECINLIP